ncbi:MAG: anthranilate phosphoribosyltransferase [Dehalococcoidales bacterium]|nr:MAG: anthranilate phosphoribosyltransferase [Dehalococcoidales bacterium]
MIREAIQSLVSGKSLTTEDAATVMEEIMSGEATPAQFGAFVTALRLKGESVEEIAGLARVMREKATRVQVSVPTVDTCGTGGDAFGTFNISTTAAFIVAGAGLKVAKHGNRAMTSRCGSADVLEALGVKIDLRPEGVQECLEKAGIGFMFAQVFHPSMKHAAGPRREIAIRTVFNFLGPLTNPAEAQAQVIGVSDAVFAPKMAQVLQRLGCRHALVTHGEEGLDEISVCGETKVWEIKGDASSSYTITPEEFGFKRASIEDIRGGTVEENAKILRNILSGATGPARDVVLLNAAAGLVAGDLGPDIAAGVELARKVLESGAALQKLDDFIRVSQSVAQ